MDELNMLMCSCLDHKSHVLNILSNMEEILDRPSDTKWETPDATLSDSDAILLTEYWTQLKLKASILMVLDEKIIGKIDDKQKPEDAVFESADLQGMLSGKIAFTAHILEVDSPRERLMPQ